MNTQFDYNKLVYDSREITEDTVNWKDIKVGDVVIEGFLNSELCEYITLTNVDGKYWEYFENGYYKSTSPEFCHWLVKGQKHCDGKLKRIIYE
jgi:elongation factor P hydroxylase